MHGPAGKPAGESDTLDDPDQSKDVLSRARMRVADLLNKPFNIRSIALTGLFILGIFYTIYFMRSILLPVVLAMLMSYLFRPIVRAMARIKIPPTLGAAVLLLVLLAAIGYGVANLVNPLSGWIEKAPTGLSNLQHKLMPVKKSMDKVAQAGGAIEKLAAPEAAKPAVEVEKHPVREMLFANAKELIAGTVLFLILLYFLLVYDGVFMNKIIKLIPTLSDKKTAVSIAHDIESHVSRYLLTVTVINCCLGAAVGITVGLLGLRNPIMWGVMVAVLNFVPYVGALTGIVCMTIGAALSFDSFGYSLIFPAVYLGYGTLEGNFITPWVMGRSLTLNPVIILLSLTFWGWMWGVVGVIVAVPILAAFKIFCTHIKLLEPIAEFLS